MTFDDYGPYRGHPQDPRTPDEPEDDRALDELTPAEQRARLKTLTHGELVEQCLEALDDARMWRAQFEREKRARMSAEAKLRQLATDAQQVAA